MNNVAYDAGMLLDESLWPTLCLTMLESASIEAAELWLGYVPLELRKVIAERKKADPVDKTPSQPGLDEGAEAEPAVGWFAIKERMSIYCSTLRLLRSSQVQMPEQLTCQPSSSIKGWQATLRGQRSTSQLVRFAPDVLHDMTVRIADLVASAYLQEAANGKWSMLGSSNATSDVSSSNDKQLANPRLFSLEPSWWASYAHPRLSSTRQLQRFLNRISLFRWLYNNVTGVAAMMEDRLPLFILSRVKTGPALRVFDLPIRRSQELSTLAGLRYAVSLMMEAMDIIAPLTVILWTKASQVVTWVLVHWLGKGIGLLWQGIRAGVRSNSMSSKKKAQKRTKQGDLRWGILW